MHACFPLLGFCFLTIAAICCEGAYGYAVRMCVHHVEDVLQECDLLNVPSEVHDNVAAICRAVTNAVHTRLNAKCYVDDS